ncbi:MAG: hypothetical protein K8R21_01655, partial [Leptospira sp.]|nr:hypothetical protein [Leptospira sp.]
MIIDPEGKVYGTHSGEGVYTLFDNVISSIVKDFEKIGMINRKPLVQIKTERSKVPETLLSFPGKIALDESGTELFVSDSNHNRILRIDIATRKVLDVIGTGEIGLKDGGFGDALFDHPQGLFVQERKIYIADTENHVIREADLETKQVKTILGTGEQSRSFSVTGAGRSVALNSPWDLTLHNGNMFIAMAGTHQIWKADLKTLEVEVFAGSGTENIIDGKLPDAALAQPSGITRDSSKLYFADSEVSAIRSADLDPSGSISTIIGKGLFEFGDVNGKYPV